MKELLIIGGGPAALSAGVYAARRKLDIIIIAKEFGGHVSETDRIENYLGFESVGGMELAKNFEKHLRSYDVEILEDVSVKKVFQKNSKVIAELEDGKIIEGKTVIIATGSRRKKLNIPGEEKFTNKGVTYCSICDGPLFRNQNVAVIGGSYAGTKAALYLSKIAKKVYLLEIEDKLGGEKITHDELKKRKNVEIVTSAKTTEIFGNQGVEGLKYLDLKNNKERKIEVEGISIEIGIIPNSEVTDVKKNKNAQIEVDEKMKTSSERIFAVGDVNDKGPEQIIVAAAQGCIAVLEAEKIISSG